jgi:predicted XRE-type DNA-binding protein
MILARFRELEEPVEPGVEASAESRLLTLAYAVEAAVEDRRFASVAEVAQVLGLSRSRLSQVMQRRWGSVGEHERVLARGAT